MIENLVGFISLQYTSGDSWVDERLQRPPCKGLGKKEITDFIPSDHARQASKCDSKAILPERLPVLAVMSTKHRSRKICSRSRDSMHDTISRWRRPG